MESQNSASFFAAMMAVIPADWKEESDRKEIPYIGYEIIMYDTLLFALLMESLLSYMEYFIEILSHYRYMLKFKKTQFLETPKEFFGVYVRNKGGTLAESKQSLFKAQE